MFPNVLLFLILFFFSPTSSETFTRPTTKAQPNTNAIYNISKSLCFACWADSLEFLVAHNFVRAAHWELPLLWDSRLEAYARWWASQRWADCRPMHSFPEGGFKLGENIFWAAGSDWAPADAVRAWADEEKYYSYAANACQNGHVCGHYTQIVWSRTRRAGCARVVCASGDVFMNCNYDPPGNYVGERPY